MEFIAASCAIKAPFNLLFRAVKPWKPYYAHIAIGILGLFRRIFLCMLVAVGFDSRLFDLSRPLFHSQPFS
jgi:hypothetical protein